MEILRERGVEFDVVEYLEMPPDARALRRILRAIPNPPAELVRKDKRFHDLGLDADRYTTEAAVVDLLLEHPELMQRPVVFRGARAIIARPAETVLELLD